MTKPELFYYGSSAPAPKPYHYKECGLDNIYLKNGFSIERVDDEEYVSIEDVDGLWKAIGLTLVTGKKTFSPAEIRFLRTQMDMTQAELASYLRVDDQTVARWEKKKCKIPGPADVALRFLFMNSPVAQPEGNKILKNLRQTIEDLVTEDAPIIDEIHFKWDHSWETQRAAVVFA